MRSRKRPVVIDLTLCDAEEEPHNVIVLDDEEPARPHRGETIVLLDMDAVEAPAVVAAPGRRARRPREKRRRTSTCRLCGKRATAGHLASATHKELERHAKRARARARARVGGDVGLHADTLAAMGFPRADAMRAAQTRPTLERALEYLLAGMGGVAAPADDVQALATFFEVDAALVAQLCVAPDSMEATREAAFQGDALWKHLCTQWLIRAHPHWGRHELTLRRALHERNRTMKDALALIAPSLSGMNEHPAGTLFEALLFHTPPESRPRVVDRWMTQVERYYFD